jgi:cytochrome c553
MMRRVERRLRRLLIAVGVLVGGLAGVSLVVAFVFGGSGSGTSASFQGGVSIEDLPRWIQQEHLPAPALPGAKLFAVLGCTACHTYAGTGNSNVDAPDLTTIGSRHLGIALEVEHVECPSCVVPGSPMPPYASLSDTRLHQLAVFLQDSKGVR